MERKKTLFADNRIVYLENPKESTEKLTKIKELNITGRHN